MQKRFIYGSVLLIMVNFIIRLIGFTYDVQLSSLIGAEGIGLFQMVMPLMMIFLIITTAGIPTAVSKLIAEQSSKNNYYTVKKIYRTAVLFTLFLSIVLSTGLVLSAKYISFNVFKNPSVLYCIYALAPALILISMTSVIRGYYYGLQMMGTASISEIVEHSARFIIILWLLYYLSPSDPVKGALIAVIGVSIGEIFDLMWLVFIQNRLVKKLPYIIPIKIKTSMVLKKIMDISVPLTITGLFHSSSQFINAAIVPRKLMEYGYTSSQATAAFGRLMGMAMPLIYLPYIITSALVINIIPSISQQMQLKNYKNVRTDIFLAIKITLLITIPLTVLYILHGKQLATLLYKDPQAGVYIHMMGYSTIFLSMQHIFSGILNGLGKQTKASLHRILGIIIQLLAVFHLIDQPQFGIKGFFLGFFLCTFTICLMDLYTIHKTIILKLPFTTLK